MTHESALQMAVSRAHAAAVRARETTGAAVAASEGLVLAQCARAFITQLTADVDGATGPHGELQERSVEGVRPPRAPSIVKLLLEWSFCRSAAASWTACDATGAAGTEVGELLHAYGNLRRYVLLPDPSVTVAELGRSWHLVTAALAGMASRLVDITVDDYSRAVRKAVRPISVQLLRAAQAIHLATAGSEGAHADRGHLRRPAAHPLLPASDLPAHLRFAPGVAPWAQQMATASQEAYASSCWVVEFAAALMPKCPDVSQLTQGLSDALDGLYRHAVRAARAIHCASVVSGDAGARLTGEPTPTRRAAQ